MLAGGIVALCDHLCFRRTKVVDAADVINMALRQYDVWGGPGIDRVKLALVSQGFKPHSGIDDDATGICHYHVGVGCAC